MIAHESKPDRGTEAEPDDADSRSPSRLTNLELRVGRLKLPPMWEIKNLAVKLRLAPASGPYSTAFRLLVVLLVILAAVALLFHLGAL